MLDSFLGYLASQRARDMSEVGIGKNVSHTLAAIQMN